MTKFTDNIASYKEPITKELIKLINNQLKAQASLQKRYARIMMPTDLMWLQVLQELSIDSDFKPETACRAMKKYYSDIINRIGNYYAKQGIDTEYYKVTGKKKYLDLDVVMQSLNYESETSDDDLTYNLNHNQEITGEKVRGVDDKVEQDDERQSDIQDKLGDLTTEKGGAEKRSESVQKNGNKLNNEVDKNNREPENKGGWQSDRAGNADLNQVTGNTLVGDASKAVGKMQEKNNGSLFSRLFKHRNLIRKQVIVIRW